MPSKRPSYIWRKAALPSWFEAHEQQLAQKTGGEFAVIERPARKRLLIEAFCRTIRTAQQLRNAFGGSVAKLSPNWKSTMFAAGRVAPMQIGKRVVVVSDRCDVPAAA